MVTSSKRASQNDSQSTAGQTPRYATFNSTKVLICGYPEDVVAELSQYIEREGGKVWKKYYKGQRPHVIICGTVADRSCQEARRALQDAVPVVTHQWVEECAKQKAQVDFGPHKLKPLAGLEISATNFPARERVVLTKMVEAAGGIYSAELHKGRTTHLLCKTGSGKKYSAAVQWRCVSVVTDAWLRESVSLGYPAPESQYKVDPMFDSRPVDAAAKAAPAAAVPQLNAVSESVMFGSTAKAASLNTADKQQQQQQQPDPGQEASSSRPTARTTQAPAAAAAAAPEAMAGCVTRRGSQRLSQPAAGAQAPGSVDERAPGRGAVSVSGSYSRLAALGIEDVDAAPMFLERVVMWWCGVPAGISEHLELQCILHAYAGVRFPDLCEATTHIMIGAHAQVDDLKTVQQYLNACNRRVEVVSPAWLQLCHQEQRMAPADTRCRLQLNSLMRSAAVLGAAGAAGAGAASQGPGGSRPAAGASAGVFANTASRGGPPVDTEQPEAAWVPEYWREQPADPLKLFDGCYFTLAAVHSFQAEHEKALSHIRRLGGKVFTADSTKPPVQWPKVFAVCPASLSREAETALMAADASFRLVHPSCRVTSYWMDMSVKHAELLRVTPRNPLLAPLRFALPLRDFTNISVAVTGYKEGQRSTIERLVLLLGGTFCKSLGRKHRATHLILPRWGPDATAADGGSSTTSSAQQIPDSTLKKIAYAQRHRLEMVVSEWLLDCAAEGRRVQEGLHRPDGDVTLLQLPAAGATQAGGATQLGSTQAYGLQQTQSQAVAPVSRQASSAAMSGPKSLASFLSSQAPCIPRPPAAASRPAAAAAAAAAGHAAAGASSNDAGGATALPPPPSRSNWFTANKVTSKPQSSQQPQQQQQRQQQEAPPNIEVAPVADQTRKLQQQQQEEEAVLPAEPDAPAQLQAEQRQDQAQQQEQQEQQQQPLQEQQPRSKQPGRSKGASPRKSPAAPGRSAATRKRAAAASSSAVDVGQPDKSTGAEQQQQLDASQSQHKRPRKEQQQQHSSPELDMAAADVQHPEAEAAVTAATAAAPAAGGTAATVPSAAGLGDAADNCSQGPDAALEGMLSMLATYHGRDTNIPASQAMAGDMMGDPLLSTGGHGGSGTAGAGSGGGGSGGAQSGGHHGLRSKRRAGGMSRASSGGAVSGPESLEGAATASEQAGSAAGASSAAAAAPPGAKKLRRGSTSAKPAAGSAACAAVSDAGQQVAAGGSSAMLPPARKSSGGSGGALGSAGPQAAAGAAAAGGGSSRTGTTRRSASSSILADVAFEPSQQVGYDVGENPEALLAAGSGGGRGQRRAAEQKQAMLARLSSLRSRSGS